jgi:UDP-2-acetamido-2-deoxy-ribo-hexuluronate aminotransferase
MIPFIDLKRNNNLDRFFFQNIKKFFNKKIFSGGEIIDKLESKLAKKLDTKYCVSCANGTDALQIALRSLKIGKGDKVLVSNNTFWATLEAVINVGADPIICDIELKTFGYDLTLVKKILKKYKIKAIISANLYGGCSENLPQIDALCKKKNIFHIQDNAQAFGVKLQNKSIFNYGIISTVSFYPAKVLGASGDAGAIFTNNKKIYEIAKKVRNHGRKTHYSYDYYGFNSRTDCIHALYILHRLNFIDKEIKDRVQKNLIYKNNLINKNLNFHSWDNKIKFNGYLNMIICKEKAIRFKLEKKLIKNKIGYGRVYPETLCSQKINYKIKKELNGNSQYLCDRIINLPLFPGIKKKEILKVIEIINEI